jgi:hypothetical protein
MAPSILGRDPVRPPDLEPRIPGGARTCTGHRREKHMATKKKAAKKTTKKKAAKK